MYPQEKSRIVIAPANHYANSVKLLVVTGLFSSLVTVAGIVVVPSLIRSPEVEGPTSARSR